MNPTTLDKTRLVCMQGQTYSSSGSAYSGYTYFNGCALGGGCGSSGTDGIGFGDLQGHLRANHGDRGFGGTAWPGAFSAKWSMPKHCLTEHAGAMLIRACRSRA